MFRRKGGRLNALYFYSPIKFSSATRKGASHPANSPTLPPAHLLLLFLFLTRLKASGPFFSRPRPDVCVNLNKAVSKWATAPRACLPGRDRGQRRYTARSGPPVFGAHYFEARPLRGLDTVQRGRVLDARAGNRTARSLAYQAVNKTEMGSSGRGQVLPACLPLPARPPLSTNTSGVNANLSSRVFFFFFSSTAVTTLPHDATPHPHQCPHHTPPPPRKPQAEGSHLLWIHGNYFCNAKTINNKICMESGFIPPRLVAQKRAS